MIVEVKIQDKILYVFYCYDKSELSDVEDKQLEKLIERAKTIVTERYKYGGPLVLNSKVAEKSLTIISLRNERGQGLCLVISDLKDVKPCMCRERIFTYYCTTKVALHPSYSTVRRKNYGKKTRHFY